MQAHVDVPRQNVVGQRPDDVQLLVGLLSQELCVHLLPAMTLPLRLLRVDDANRLPYLLQIVQVVATPGGQII